MLLTSPGLGFKVKGLRVKGLGLRFQPFTVQDFGFRVESDACLAG